MNDEPAEVEFGLAVPFVVCESKGGPFRDQDFVCGFECGRVDALLQQGPVRLRTEVHTECVPQMDLCAMYRGYVMTAEESFVDGWTDVKFEKARDEK